MPCKGLYADVEKEVDTEVVEKMRKFDNLLASYEEYKRGSVQNIKFPERLTGMY